jgi:hypothetical protein
MGNGDRKWSSRNPEYKKRKLDRNKEKARQRRIQSRGLTIEEYDVMVGDQGCVCACCSRPFTKAVIHSRKNPDRVWGVLCIGCYRLIAMNWGSFSLKIKRFQQLITYLESRTAQTTRLPLQPETNP